MIKQNKEMTIVPITAIRTFRRKPYENTISVNEYLEKIKSKSQNRRCDLTKT